MKLTMWRVLVVLNTYTKSWWKIVFFTFPSLIIVKWQGRRQKANSDSDRPKTNTAFSRKSTSVAK